MREVVSEEKNIIKIPPLKDSHIHFTIDGRPAGNDTLVEIASNLIGKGIMCVCDMGYKTGHGVRAKEFFKERFPILKVMTACYALYKKGTYGVFLGKGISEKNEIPKTVKEIAAQGADFIKLVNSGIVSAKGGPHVTPGGFMAEELKIICETAGELNLPVTCHANGDEAIRNAIIAGVSSIEHGYFVSNETLHMMKDKNIYWTPTVFALKSYSFMLSDNERRYIEEVIDNHMQSINYASSIGIRLTVGTDSGSKGVRHGESFFEELRLFQKAGLSLEQILSAACMGEYEIDKGNYLIAEKDFIITGKIEAIFSDGNQMIFRQLF
jgi:imidazolonepropionase-like amidohydrolase